LEFGEILGPNGKPVMPDSVVKYVQIPTQMESEEEADAVGSTALLSSGSTSYVMSFDFITKMLLA